jgi:DnaJ-class molecular chaperone
MSKKYHPDLNPDEATHEKFIELSKGEPVHPNFKRGPD